METDAVFVEKASTPPLTRAMSGRYVVINADDFGLSVGVNAGILHAHLHGIVTSASLMVRQPFAAHAVEAQTHCPLLGLGLHLDLGEWRCTSGRWETIYQRVCLDDDSAVRQEIVEQLELFESLVGRAPTHVDSHQHVHKEEPVRSAVEELFGDREIPIRHLTAGVRYCGEFYAQTGAGEPLPELISAAGLCRLLSRLEPGLTEVACHPGFDDELPSAYSRERRREVEVLCNDEVRASIEAGGILLTSFSEVRRYLFPKRL